MEINMNRLTQAIQADFEGVDRKELEAFAAYMGVEYHPNIGDERLRGRILEKLGKGPVEMTAEDGVVTPNAPGKPDGLLSIPELMGLNLGPNGAWEGRKRMVSIVRPDEYKGNNAHPFNWGRYRVMIPWGRPVSVAYPIFDIIKNANFKEVYQVRTAGRDGTPKIVNEFTTLNRFRFTDMGDDPATAHLPTSQQDQFSQIAERSNFFEGWDVRKMTRTARRLNLRYPRGATYEELRDIILTSLGYDVDLMEFAA